MTYTNCYDYSNMLTATSTDALGSLGSLAKVATDQLLSGWADPTGFLASQLNSQTAQACLDDFTFGVDSFAEQTVPGSIMFFSSLITLFLRIRDSPTFVIFACVGSFTYYNQ